MSIFKPRTAQVPGHPTTTTPTTPPGPAGAQYAHVMFRQDGQPVQPSASILLFDDPTWTPAVGWNAPDGRVYFDFSHYPKTPQYGWEVTINLRVRASDPVITLRATLAGDMEIVLPAGWPATPTRAEVCTVQVPFQGFTAHTQQFGSIPAFGPELSTLSDDDLASYLDQVKADSATRVSLGLNPWTHVEFAVSWNYRGATYSYPVPGRDLSQDLPELRRRIDIAIRAGFKILLFCAGDGLGAGPGYNDPVGWTYGYDWLMANFQRIYDAMGPTPASPNDARDFIGFLPGYDGTDSYGWETPERVVGWWEFARQVIDRGGHGYLGQEFSIGHCQIGGQWDGEPTYVNGPGQALDFILQEFPASCPMPTADPDAVFQILGRMIRPYNRPPEQPSDDDPTPPFYLGQGTPRGRYYYCAYEYGTYQWVRGQISAAQVELDRTYLKRCGCTIVC